MKVRTRSRLILVATVIIFLVVLSFVTQLVILESFRNVEKQEMTAHVQRVVAQLNGDVEDVGATCRDWAERKDTYDVMSGPDPGHDPDGLVDPFSLRSLGIDYILAYDSSGKLVFSGGFSGRTGQIRRFPESWMR